MRFVLVAVAAVLLAACVPETSQAPPRKPVPVTTTTTNDVHCLSLDCEDDLDVHTL